MKRDFVDFSEVPAHQQAIHARLENWGLSQRNGPRKHVSPGFEAYRSGNTWITLEPKTAIDQRDAIKIGQGVRNLPAKHALSIAWYYVRGHQSPTKARRDIGCTAQELAQYVVDGRQILMNRCV